MEVPRDAAGKGSLAGTTPASRKGPGMRPTGPDARPEVTSPAIVVVIVKPEGIPPVTVAVIGMKEVPPDVTGVTTIGEASPPDTGTVIVRVCCDALDGIIFDS